MKNYSVVKEAVRTILMYGANLELITDVFNNVYVYANCKVNEKVNWAYAALQWAGFKSGDVEPYAFPKFAFEYEAKIRNRIVPVSTPIFIVETEDKQKWEYEEYVEAIDQQEMLWKNYEVISSITYKI